MTMRNLMLTTVPTLLLAVAAPASAQQADDPRDPLSGAQITASDGGKTSAGQPLTIAEDADPLNRMVKEQTANGLVVALTIDGAAVRLDSAVPARVPLSIAKAGKGAEGDRVLVIAYAGGQEIARTEVSDVVLNASEGEGLVRTTTRQVVVPLAVSRPVEEIEVSAPATGARARLDVSGAWQPYCDRERRSPWCVTRR